MAFPYLDKLMAAKDFFSGSTPAAAETDDCDCDTKWDRFINSIKRTLRLFTIVGIFMFFTAAWTHTGHFSEFAKALALVPDQMWYVILTVLGMWFGFKGIADMRGLSGGGSGLTVSTTISTARAMPAPTMVNGIQDDHPLLDNLALINPSIEAWKKKYAA